MPPTYTPITLQQMGALCMGRPKGSRNARKGGYKVAYMSWGLIRDQVDARFLSDTAKAQKRLEKRLLEEAEKFAHPSQAFQRWYEQQVNEDIDTRPWVCDYQTYGILEG